MSHPAPPSKPIVIRARPDTVALVCGAVALTFALSYNIHARPDRLGHGPEVARVTQDWAGGLAEMAPVAVAASEPITSASLVVPKAELALPATPVRPLVKLRGCEDSNCVAKVSAPPAPVRRAMAAVAEGNRSAARHAHDKDRATLMSSLNPLNHLPDMSIIRRPLVYAGNTFTGWFKRD